MEENKKCWGLLRRRSCLVPTWRGWLVLILGFMALGFGFASSIYPFLAPTAPLPGGVLVIEGWAPDYALEAAVAEFRHHHYDKLFVIGGPIDQGAPLIQYKTYAEVGMATLLKLGLNTDEVQAVPAPGVRQDRTYAAAVALAQWWRDHGLAPAKVHFLGGGPHTRRSWLLVQKALGSSANVGVTAIEPRDYDPKHWWRYSAGVRGILDETVAYFYARCLFFPPRNAEAPGS